MSKRFNFSTDPVRTHWIPFSNRLFFAVATGRESYIYTDDFLPEKISPAARRTADRPVRQVRSIAIAVAACRGLLVLDRRRYTSVCSASFRLFPWPLCEPSPYIATIGTPGLPADRSGFVEIPRPFFTLGLHASHAQGVSFFDFTSNRNGHFLERMKIFFFYQMINK